MSETPEELENSRPSSKHSYEVRESTPISNHSENIAHTPEALHESEQEELFENVHEEKLEIHHVEFADEEIPIEKPIEKHIEKHHEIPQIPQAIVQEPEVTKKEEGKSDFELDWSGSSYNGPMQDGWFEGFGRFRFPKGVVYEGDFHKGEFHGKGTLIFPNGGRYKANWNRGRAVDGEYEYYDGLKYNAQDWNYCKIPDRRFYTEIKEGLRPAGATLIVNDPKGPNSIPPGTYDIGEGYYNPNQNAAYSYEGENLDAPMDSDLVDILKKYRYNPAQMDNLSDDDDILVK